MFKNSFSFLLFASNVAGLGRRWGAVSFSLATLLASERTCLHLILESASHPSPATPSPLPEGEGEISKAYPPVHSTMGRGCQGSASTCCFTRPLPPLHLPASFSCTRIVWRGGDGPDWFLRQKGGEEELRFSCRVPANEATAAPRVSKKQGKSAQLMRGGGNVRGGEGKSGRREGGPLQQQVQPLPPAAVEEE
jgi:hypothetical protein